MYLGDFTVGSTIVCKFNTKKFSDGTPVTLAGTPAILCYKDSTTESASTGITLTVDYDSRTGMHSVSIDTSANSTFFVAGKDYDIVVTTGTVDSISYVGTIVGTFSLDNRSIAAVASAVTTNINDTLPLFILGGVSLSESLSSSTDGTAQSFLSDFFLALSGTWVGLAQLKRSTDSGVTYSLAWSSTANTTKPIRIRNATPSDLWRVTFTKTSGTLVIDTNGLVDNGA